MGKLLSSIFDPRSIKLNLGGKTKEMVLVELIDAMPYIITGQEGRV